MRAISRAVTPPVPATSTTATGACCRRYARPRFQSGLAAPREGLGELPPHSMLATGALLRSLLVNAISSHRTLLTPSLWTLSTIADPAKKGFVGSLLDVHRNPLLRRFLKATVYDQFCAGQNAAEAMETVRGIKKMGYQGVILTYARELVDGPGEEAEDRGTEEAVAKQQIQEWYDGVMKTLEIIGKDDFLALKFTGAGNAVAKVLEASNEPLPSQMADAIDRICDRAMERQVRIFVDAEHQSVQHSIDTITLDMMRTFNRNGKVLVYNTYQIYLKSAPQTLLAHLKTAAADGFAVGVKLVRGAYINSEPRYLIHDTKDDTDAAYNLVVKALLERQYAPLGRSSIGGPLPLPFPHIELFLGTHNKESVLFAHDLSETRLNTQQLTPRVQYGQLLGMADDVSCRLLQRAAIAKRAGSVPPQVYKCTSWGPLDDCLAYLVRRAVENRDAVSRTWEEYAALKAEAWRRLKTRG